MWLDPSYCYLNMKTLYVHWVIKKTIIILALSSWPRLGQGKKNESRMMPRHGMTQMHLQGKLKVCESAREEHSTFPSAFSHWESHQSFNLWRFLGYGLSNQTLFKLNHYKALENGFNKMDSKSKQNGVKCLIWLCFVGLWTFEVLS